MSKINDGGPAFAGVWVNPCDGNATAPDGAVVPPQGTHHMVGMSLREYFAAHAPPMPDDWASFRRLGVPDQIAGYETLRLQVEWAYAYADAMLVRMART